METLVSSIEKSEKFSQNQLEIFSRSSENVEEVKLFIQKHESKIDPILQQLVITLSISC